MKISELIKELEHIKQVVGDVQVQNNPEPIVLEYYEDGKYCNLCVWKSDSSDTESDRRK